jgi:hypothetical protein
VAPEQLMLIGMYILFVVISVIVMVVSIRSRHTAYQSRDRPQCEGTIVTSELVEWDTEHGSPAKVNIEYEYTVAGRRFESTRISLGGGENVYTNFHFPYAPLLKRYPVQTKVVVYYNPNHPQQSVFERQMPVSVPVGVILAAAIIAWSVPMLPGAMGLAGA